MIFSCTIIICAPTDLQRNNMLSNAIGPNRKIDDLKVFDRNVYHRPLLSIVQLRLLILYCEYTNRVHLSVVGTAEAIMLITRVVLVFIMAT